MVDMNKHFYRHALTNQIAKLDDDFAAVFGDVFERVTETAAKKAATSPEDDATPKAASAAKNDSSKEGN